MDNFYIVERKLVSEGIYSLSDLLYTLASQGVSDAEGLASDLPPMPTELDERAGGLALWIAERLYPWPEAA